MIVSFNVAGLGQFLSVWAITKLQHESGFVVGATSNMYNEAKLYRGVFSHKTGRLPSRLWISTDWRDFINGERNYPKKGRAHGLGGDDFCILLEDPTYEPDAFCMAHGVQVLHTKFYEGKENQHMQILGYDLEQTVAEITTCLANQIVKQNSLELADASS